MTVHKIVVDLQYLNLTADNDHYSNLALTSDTHMNSMVSSSLQWLEPRQMANHEESIPHVHLNDKQK